MGKIIAAYGGGFKPPTKGHFQVVEDALSKFPEIDELIIYVGSGTRDGISQLESILVWEVYNNYLPIKVKIEPSKSPIGDIIRLGKNNPQDTIYFVIGSREGNEGDQKDYESRTKNIEEKYPNMEVKLITTSGGEISGTKARKALLISPEEFYKYVPEVLNDNERGEVFDTLRQTVKESLNENASYSQDINIQKRIDQLTQHMLDKGYNIEPLPTVEFVDGDSDNAREFLGKTAYYNPNNQTITLYTEGRHPKDIVRSFSHEMIHHIQNLEGRLGAITTTNTQEDDNLNDIEAEANLKGTMTFRNWTDSLNEVQNPTLDTTLKQYLNTDTMSGGNISLNDVFAGEDIDVLINTHPDKFSIPTSYTPPNMYFWRGLSMPLENIKKLGPFLEDETLEGRNYISSHDKEFQNSGLKSFTTFPNVAVGFSEFAASYPDENNFNPKTDEIPVILAVEYSKHGKDFFGNPEYFSKISKHGNEGEVFFKGSNYKADVFIPNYVKKYLNMGENKTKDPFGLNQYARELATGLEEAIVGEKIKCDNCGWDWNIVDGGDDLFICHKCDHDNTPLDGKKSKDPFGLNEYVQELSKPEGVESLTEGRYDRLTSQLSKIVFTKFKEIHDTGKNKGEFEYSIGSDEGEDDVISNEFEFDLKISVEISDDEYIPNGGANAGIDDDGDEVRPVVMVYFLIPKNPDWQEVSFDIKDIVRHEIEHLTQDGENLKPSKYLEDDELERALIKAKHLPKSHYYKLDKEVDAMLQGLYFRAKKEKIPFKDSIKNYLDKVDLTSEEKKEVIKVWRTRRGALSLPLFENKEDMKYTIYSDMDGVLSDFDKRFMEFSKGLTPREYETKYGKGGFWKLIDETVGVPFWAGMDWMSDGKEYWDYIKKYDPIILSAPSRREESKYGKRIWKKRNMPTTKMILTYAKDKKKYANENSILIDDRESNVSEWRSAGGIGILHVSSADTINQLKKLGL